MCAEKIGGFEQPDKIISLRPETKEALKKAYEYKVIESRLKPRGKFSGIIRNSPLAKTLTPEDWAEEKKFITNAWRQKEKKPKRKEGRIEKAD